jgi:hypothetical protein
MFTDEHALFQLLPAYIRSRDAAAKGELEQLLAVVGDQAVALQRDLERMYDGWFIETCDEWVIPYIADLVGVEPAHVSSGDDVERAGQLARVLSARAATANAIAHRRRKGTLQILEELARDVAHWPARAVEFYRRVVAASHLDHLQPSRAAVADIRSAHTLSQLNGPFDERCHLTDVRRIGNADSPGRYAVQNVGLFVWRLRAYPVTRTTAYCREDIGKHCFTFSALGHDTALFRAPLNDDLPTEITRTMLERDPLPGAESTSADPALYGRGASLVVETQDWPTRAAKDATSEASPAIPAGKVIPADLSDWSYKVPKGHVAVDPVLGRIAFPLAQAPRREVKVSYRYGFAADIGGGEYPREAVPLPPSFERVRIWPDGQRSGAKSTTIASELVSWRKRHPRAPKGDQQERALVIELMASGVYEGRFDVALEEHETIAIVAAPGARPVVWLTDQSPGSPEAITIRGRRGSRAILDGLLVAGRGVEVGDLVAEAGGERRAESSTGAGGLCEVWIRHCTLVPGSALGPGCNPLRPSEPSLVLDDTTACVRIDASIVGAIRVLRERLTHEPSAIVISDSIVDATGAERVAIGGADTRVAYATLAAERSTIVGRVAIHVVDRADDCIFASTVEVARRQTGCIRFSYVPPGSRTPRRYECEPDGAIRAAEPGAREYVAPRFENVRYGSPAYLRLTADTSARITSGADDKSEMGVYHDLFEPQRLSLLRDRLAEFVPASCDAAVVCVS